MGLFSSVGKIISKVTSSPLFSIGADLLGGALSDKSVRDANDTNRDVQYDMARNGIQMRVADAKAAGIHPLMALGVQPFSPSPTAVGSSGVGDSISRMGQNMSRASLATASADKRREALMLENASLQNDLLRAQISMINRPNNPPFPGSAMVIDGQGNAPSRERETIPDVGFAETEQRGLAPVMSSAVKQRTEDSLLQELEWYLRNRINPFALLRGPGPAPRKGMVWDPAYQQYRNKSDIKKEKFLGVVPYPGRR